MQLKYAKIHTWSRWLSDVGSFYGSEGWEFESLRAHFLSFLTKEILRGCNAIGYTITVICSFRHKGLKRLFENGSRRKIPPQHAERITRQLDALHATKVVQDLNLPGFGLHELKGNRKGIWAISVTGNLRITFSFKNGEARSVDLEDYH